MIKADWLAAGGIQREVGTVFVIFLELASNLQILPASRIQDQVSDEIFQALLTNQKQGKIG
jgi:hypothetical protein